MKANHNPRTDHSRRNPVGINIRKTTEVALDNESKSQRKDARLCVSTCWDKYQKNRPSSRQTGLAVEKESKTRNKGGNLIFISQAISKKDRKPSDIDLHPWQKEITTKPIFNNSFSIYSTFSSSVF